MQEDQPEKTERSDAKKPLPRWPAIPLAAVAAALVYDKMTGGNANVLIAGLALLAAFNIWTNLGKRPFFSFKR